MPARHIAHLFSMFHQAEVPTRLHRVYCGDRDRPFRRIVTAAQRAVLRPEILVHAVTMMPIFDYVSRFRLATAKRSSAEVLQTLRSSSAAMRRFTFGV